MTAPSGPARPVASVDEPSTSVLVVEDDPGIATQLVRGLSRGGYRVDHVMTGSEALAWGDPDVVLLDLELPDVDGVNVCRQLRERSSAAIIVVTAYGEEPDRVNALDAGADDYLVKPFGLAELQARIRAVLRRVRPGRRADQARAADGGPADPQGDGLRPGGGADAQGVRHPRVPGRRSGAGREQAGDAGRRPGTRTGTGRPRYWTCTSPRCAASSAQPGLIETVYGRGFRLGEV